MNNNFTADDIVYDFMPTKEIQRKRLNSLKAWVILFIFGIYEVIFVHKFFLHTFFRSSISNVPPPIDLKISYWDKLQFKTILLLRYLFKDQFWGQQWFKSVHHRILKNIENQNIDLSLLKRPIPTVEAGTISSEEFFEQYVKANKPVIIKGGCKQNFACQNWSTKLFRERFGDLEVRVNIFNEKTGENKYFFSKLRDIDVEDDDFYLVSFSSDVFSSDPLIVKDIVSDKSDNDKMYVSLCSDIFSNYPELLDEVGCLEYESHMGGKSTFFSGAQLLLGAPFTGSDIHCAEANNLFFQISGKKRWTLVHPDYLWLMYPMLNRSFLYVASFVKRDYDFSYLQKYSPLQNYCPRYESVLEPGDVLLNPPWQWHAVDNLKERTVGVATRWPAASEQKRSNNFFSLIQLFSPYVWNARFDVVMQRLNGKAFLNQGTTSSTQFPKKDLSGLDNTDNTVEMAVPTFDQWSKEDRFY